MVLGPTDALVKHAGADIVVVRREVQKILAIVAEVVARIACVVPDETIKQVIRTTVLVSADVNNDLVVVDVSLPLAAVLLGRQIGIEGRHESSDVGNLSTASGG